MCVKIFSISPHSTWLLYPYCESKQEDMVPNESGEGNADWSSSSSMLNQRTKERKPVRKCLFLPLPAFSVLY